MTKCYYCGSALNETFNDLIHVECKDKMLIEIYEKLQCIPKRYKYK